MKRFAVIYKIDGTIRYDIVADSEEEAKSRASALVSEGRYLACSSKLSPETVEYIAHRVLSDKDGNIDPMIMNNPKGIYIHDDAEVESLHPAKIEYSHCYSVNDRTIRADDEYEEFII